MIIVEVEYFKEISFDKKHGESLVFDELPVGKKFYFLKDKRESLREGTYNNYYVKDGSGDAHVCMTSQGKGTRPLGFTLKVNPKAAIIFLNINSV